MSSSRRHTFGGGFIFFLLTIALSTTTLVGVCDGKSLGFGNEISPYPEPTYDEVAKVSSVGTRHNYALPESTQTVYPLLPNYRQDVCERYQQVRLGNVTLRDALKGLELRPLMRVGTFFQYTNENGIDPDDPGLLAIMMDELARRAGFTWRNSFGVVFGLPEPPTTNVDKTTTTRESSNSTTASLSPPSSTVGFENPDFLEGGEFDNNSTFTIDNFSTERTTSTPTSAPSAAATTKTTAAGTAAATTSTDGEVHYPPLTFTDLLIWSVDTYDISINWWDQSLERLERGASFLQPWFDGSIILVQKGARTPSVVDEYSINWWNWSKPFEPQVWWLTIFTVITSGLTYQWIEYLSGHRKNRSWWQWFSDNVYLSAINFPQNYEFQPQSAAGRLFGVSIGIWALVMTATYTANLASLLVDTKIPWIALESIEDAVALGVPLCVYENTGADAHIKLKYKQAKRVPFPSELETFQGLNDGQCDATVAYYQNWLGYESQRAYNPDCDLAWVGRAVKSIQSGFAVTADTGHKCSSLIRDVLDLYLNELLESGFIEDMWDAHYAKTQDINCDAIRPEVLAAGKEEDDEDSDDARRRLRKFDADAQLRHHHAVQEKHFNPHPTISSHTTATSRSGEQRRRLQRQTEERQRRKLKTSGRSGAAAVGGFEEADASQMTINQMAGTFLLHYGVSAIAIAIGYFTRYYNNKHKEKVKAFVGRSSRNLQRSVSTWSVRRKDGSVNGERRPATWNGSTIEDSNNELDDPPDGIVAKMNGNSLRNGSVTKESVRSVSFAASDEPKVVSTPQPTNSDALQSVQDELRETKEELKQTRQEMTEQMNMIRSLLEEIHRDKMQQLDGWNEA